MPTVTKFASVNQTVTTGWTDPTNAYADDGVYATAAPAKNATVSTRYGFANFGTGDIPAGSTINSVTAEIQFKVSTTDSIATMGLQLFTGSTGGSKTAVGSQQTDATEPTTDTLLTHVDTTTITLAHLGADTDTDNISGVWALVEAIRGNSNTAVTFSVDYVKLTVDYTPPAQNVTAPSIASGSSLFASTLAYAVTTAAIAAGSALFAPSVAAAAGGDQEVTTPTIASTAQLFAPTLAQEVAPSPSVSISDTFTDTAGTLLAVHTSDSGHTWIKHPDLSTGAGDLIITDAGRLRNDDGFSSHTYYYPDYEPLTPDYDVSATVVLGDFAFDGNADIIARLPTTFSGFSDAVYLQLVHGIALQLFEDTAIGEVDYSEPPGGLGLQGETHTMRLVVRGATAVGYWDGVPMVRISGLANSAVVGRAAVTVFTDATADGEATEVDSFTVEDRPTIPSGSALFAPSIAQEVNAPTIAATTQVFAPTVTPPAQDLSLPTIGSTVLYFAPTVTADQAVDLPAIAAGSSLSSPTLAYGVEPPSIGSTVALFAPSVAYEVELPTIASTATLNAPTVDQVTLLLLPTIPSGSVVSEPTVAYEIEPPTIGSGAQLFAPSVGAFTPLDLPTIPSGHSVTEPSLAYELEPPTIGSGVQLFAPSVDADQAVELPTIAAGSQVFAPALGAFSELELPDIPSGSSVAVPTLAYEVELPAIPAGSTLTPPSVALNVSTPTIASGSQVFAPSLAAFTTLEPPAIPAGSTLSAPTLAYAVELPAIAAGTTLFAPTVTGDGDLALPTIPSGSQLFAPTIEQDPALILPTIPSGTALNTPSLAYTAVLPTIAAGSTVTEPSLAYEIEPTAIASGSQVFAPALEQEPVLAPPAIASTAVLNAPSLAYAVTTPTIASGSTLAAPTIPADQALELPTIASGSTVSVPTVREGDPPVFGPARIVIIAGMSGRSINRPRLTADRIIVEGS